MLIDTNKNWGYAAKVCLVKQNYLCSHSYLWLSSTVVSLCVPACLTHIPTFGPCGPGGPSGPGKPLWPGGPGTPGKPFSPCEIKIIKLFKYPWIVLLIAYFQAINYFQYLLAFCCCGRSLPLPTLTCFCGPSLGCLGPVAPHAHKYRWIIRAQDSTQDFADYRSKLTACKV